MENSRAGATPDVAHRLHVIREYLAPGKSMRQFCADQGFGYTNWHNYERGFDVPKNTGMRIVDLLPGLSLDWLYRGGPDGMAFDLVQGLRDAEKRLKGSVATRDQA